MYTYFEKCKQIFIYQVPRCHPERERIHYIRVPGNPTLSFPSYDLENIE